MASREQETKVYVLTTFGHVIKDLHPFLVATDLSQVAAQKCFALLGDAVLKTAVLDDWYPTARTKEDGHELVQDACTNARLASVAQTIGLEEHLQHHPGQSRRASEKGLATAMEGLLAAIFLDSGKSIEAVAGAMRKVGLM